MYAPSLISLIVCMIQVQLQENGTTTEAFHYGKYGRNRLMSVDEGKKWWKKNTMSFVTPKLSHASSLVVCVIQLLTQVINTYMV